MSDTKNNKVVTQHNALTFARYDMSAAEKDIFFITLGKLGRNDSSDKIYEIRIKEELSSLTGKEKSYEHIKQTADKLSKRQIKIESLEEKKFKIINLVSSIEYKGGIVYMQLTDAIRPYLFNLKEQFTKYGLQFALSLSLKYSKRFYEMLSSWKNRGEYNTSLTDLHDVLQIKKSYKTWDNFKRKVIEPSIEEINEKTNLYVSYEVKKTGRKFTHIKFLIKEAIKVEETSGGLSQWQLEKIEELLSE